MSDRITVPNIAGLTREAAEAALTSVGLQVGTPTTLSSTTVPAGNVIRAQPAEGMVVDPGSSVSLEISSGPAQVTVPNVAGLTRVAAETMLRNAGFEVGTVTTAPSYVVPPGGVSNTIPSAGTLARQGSNVSLEISLGQKTPWSEYIPTITFAGIGLVVLSIIIFGISGSGGFLTNLANKEVARGLITFLIAITTIGLALILSLSTIMIKESDDADKRFDRGKQVLMTLIGVLGTIVGFYFGSEIRSPEEQNPAALQQSSAIRITAPTLPVGTVNVTYPTTTIQAAGGTPPMKWSIEPALPSGLALDASTGTISGKPTLASPPSKYMITVSDSATPPASSTQEVTLEIKQ